MPELRPLDQLVQVVTDKITYGKDVARPYIGLEHLGACNTGLLGSATAETSTSTNSIFEKGDVLFGKLRPNLRKCAQAPFPGYCSTDILVLRSRSGTAPGFAARAFQAEGVGAAAERTAIGTKMPRTAWQNLRDIEVFCPGLAEQTLIAQILDTLDATIHQTQMIVEKLKQVKQGLLHDLLTRGIDDNGELRPSRTEAPHLYKHTRAGYLPVDWNPCTVSHLTRVTVGHVGPIEAHFTGRDEGVPLLSTTSIGDDGQVRGEHRRVSEAFDAAHRNSHLYSGDLIVARHGKSGATAVVPPEMAAAQSLNVVIVRGAASFVSPFLAAWLNHPSTRRQLLGGQAGSVQPIVGTRGVASLIVAAPPLNEQSEISARHAAVLQRLGAEKRFADGLRSIRHGLMEDLLTGRIRARSLAA
jgi:type I restriction enzyme, S subunit